MLCNFTFVQVPLSGGTFAALFFPFNVFIGNPRRVHLTSDSFYVVVDQV